MFKLEELTGVLPALISPLSGDGSVDEAAVKRLVEHVIKGGVRGMLALGSTGETASLDEIERRALLSSVVAAAAGRVPVICGVAQSHLAAARTEVEAAARLGAVAALVAPPFYYLIDQPTVLAFYRRLAKDSPIPILLYNIPQYTKVVAEPATVATLAREGTIAGIKDSSRDFEYFEGVCVATRDLPAFRVFTGSDTMLLPSLTMGGAGTICGAANVAPHWVVRIFEAFQQRDMVAARDAQDELYQLVMVLRGGVFPAAIKAACHQQGICEPWCAAPVPPLDERLEAKLRDRLGAWGLLGALTA
ncbi:MAG TPA: dihydrodipicolinate synthase family protein [Candidatus Dormibacteraeota bacterium]|nr:dihydrodipicolinate synthase family protein [Candidatus Dormibacteraeota bacterium]